MRPSTGRIGFSKIGIVWGTYFVKSVPNFQVGWSTHATPRSMIIRVFNEVNYSWYGYHYGRVCTLFLYIVNTGNLRKSSFRKSLLVLLMKLLEKLLNWGNSFSIILLSIWFLFYYFLNLQFLHLFECKCIIKWALFVYCYSISGGDNVFFYIYVILLQFIWYDLCQLFIYWNPTITMPSLSSSNMVVCQGKNHVDNDFFQSYQSRL